MTFIILQVSLFCFLFDFVFGLILLLNSKMLFNWLLCFLSASPFAVFPLKMLSPKNLIVLNIYLFRKSIFSISSSTLLKLLNSFIILLIADVLVTCFQLILYLLLAGFKICKTWTSFSPWSSIGFACFPDVLFFTFQDDNV